jgi:ribonuclease P/MRP protein subunit POP1
MQMKEDKTPIKTKNIIPRSVRFRRENAMKLQNVTKIKKSKTQDKLTDAMDIDNGEDENEIQPATKARKPKVKKSVLREPPLPKAKFRKRQIEKTWLPTHLYHVKRAHMSPPKEPLWKFALPVTTTEKGYRLAHRAMSIRGALAWDTSYMSTIGLQGSEKSIIGLLKAMGVGSDADDVKLWNRSGERWRQGMRSWHGWLYRRQEYPAGAIGPATILWRPGESTAEHQFQQRTVYLRTHPSCFLHMWLETTRLAKVQKPSVAVEDLRYEVGSIQLTGPNSTEALVGTLHPLNLSETDDSLSTIWKTLGCCTAPSMLPTNLVLAFEVSDPRLHYPPRRLNMAKDAPQQLLEVSANWSLDKSSMTFNFFDRVARQDAVNALPTQKAINRRKGDASPAQYPKSLSTDPRIPVLLFTEPGGGLNKGSWTMLLPWKCVVPAWYPLMHFPLSSGANPRLGGVREVRQTCYEAGQPWFPADFPGTYAGKDWELQEREKVKAEWKRKPAGKRIEYDSIDLGRGRRGEIGDAWACEWTALFPDGDLTGKFFDSASA